MSLRSQIARILKREAERGSEQVFHGGPLRSSGPSFWTSSERHARLYAERAGSQRVERRSLKLANPLTLDGRGGSLRRLYDDQDAFLSQAQDAGHDGVIFRNVLDQPGNALMATPHDVYVQFDSRQARPRLDETSRLKRAHNLGFTTEAYRGLQSPYEPSTDMQFFSNRREVASDYAMHPYWPRSEPAPNVFPARLRLGQNLQVDARGSSYKIIGVSGLPREIVDELDGARVARINDLARAARAVGYDSLSVRNVIDSPSAMPGTVHVVFSPRDIRSRFARFDPRKTRSSDPLAGVAPIAIAGGGTALAGGQQRTGNAGPTATPHHAPRRLYSS